MALSLGQISLFVDDYDTALAYYCEILGFYLVCDELLPSKRWVVVSPAQHGGCQLLLVKANAEQQALIGGQGGGKVWLFLHTDDFATDYQRMLAKGVHFLEQPRHEPYGSVVVFADRYGNRWDLIQRKDC